MYKRKGESNKKNINKEKVMENEKEVDTMFEQLVREEEIMEGRRVSVELTFNEIFLIRDLAYLYTEQLKERANNIIDKMDDRLIEAESEAESEEAEERDEKENVIDEMEERIKKLEEKVNKK